MWWSERCCCCCCWWWWLGSHFCFTTTIYYRSFLFLRKTGWLIVRVCCTEEQALNLSMKEIVYSYIDIFKSMHIGIYFVWCGGGICKNVTVYERILYVSSLSLPWSFLLLFFRLLYFLRLAVAVVPCSCVYFFSFLSRHKGLYACLYSKFFVKKGISFYHGFWLGCCMSLAWMCVCVSSSLFLTAFPSPYHHHHQTIRPRTAATTTTSTTTTTTYMYPCVLCAADMTLFLSGTLYNTK